MSWKSPLVGVKSNFFLKFPFNELLALEKLFAHFFASFISHHLSFSYGVFGEGELFKEASLENPHKYILFSHI